MRLLYRMHDSAPSGVVPVRREPLGEGESYGDAPDDPDARRWNERGHGIFWTVNSFAGARRIAHLQRICAWAVDIDDGSKDAQLERISQSPLAPSLVVETRRGHQCYWQAEDARPESWNAIVLERLVPFFGADRNARDIARILRAPGYYHVKDPADPFLVRVVQRRDVSYHEAEIAERFERCASAPPRARAARSALAPKGAPGAIYRWLLSLGKGPSEAARLAAVIEGTEAVSS